MGKILERNQENETTNKATKNKQIPQTIHRRMPKRRTRRRTKTIPNFRKRKEKEKEAHTPQGEERKTTKQQGARKTKAQARNIRNNKQTRKTTGKQSQTNKTRKYIARQAKKKKNNKNKKRKTTNCNNIRTSKNEKGEMIPKENTDERKRMRQINKIIQKRRTPEEIRRDNIQQIRKRALVKIDRNANGELQKRRGINQEIDNLLQTPPGTIMKEEKTKEHMQGTEKPRK